MKTGEIQAEEKSIDGSELAAIKQLLKEQKEEIAELRKNAASNGAMTLQQMVTSAVKGVKEGDKSAITVRAGIQLGDIPKEDLDEKGTIFCHPSSGYILVDYYKNGFRVVPPYGIDKIEFELKASRRKRDGKEHQINHISMFKSNSHALTEWIKGSPLFNVAFYESMKTMDSIDVRKAVLTAKLMNTLRDWDALKIIKSCKDFNVNRHDDVEVMRNQLVLAMIDADHKREMEIVNKRVSENAKEKMLMESNVDVIK